jgi:hypothetical protein
MDPNNLRVIMFYYAAAVLLLILVFAVAVFLR